MQSVMRHLLLALSALALLALVVGCGGGGGNGNGGDNPPGVTTGRAMFVVNWPTRSKSIPYSANSLVITLRQDGRQIALQSIPRPASGSSAQVPFENVPAGDVTYDISALPKSDGSGTPVGTAGGTMKITPNQTTTVSVAAEMSSTITDTICV